MVAHTVKIVTMKILKVQQLQMFTDFGKLNHGFKSRRGRHFLFKNPTFEIVFKADLTRFPCFSLSNTLIYSLQIDLSSIYQSKTIDLWPSLNFSNFGVRKTIYLSLLTRRRVCYYCAS